MRRLMMSLVSATLLLAIFVVPQGLAQAHPGEPIVLATMSLEECNLKLWAGGPFHDAHGNQYVYPCLALAEGVPVVWQGAAH